MRAVAFLSLPVLTLCACGSEPEIDARNASVEEVGEQIRSAGSDPMFIRAGKWETNVTLERMDAPGMPPEAIEQMKRMTGARSYSSCLSEEEAQRPSEEFFTGANNQCRYDHFTMGDGKIDARMTCSRGGAEQVMELDGTYSPTTYDLRMKTDLEGASAPAPAMGMTMRVQAKRVGECEAKQS